MLPVAQFTCWQPYIVSYHHLLIQESCFCIFIFNDLANGVGFPAWPVGRFLMDWWCSFESIARKRNTQSRAVIMPLLWYSGGMVGVITWVIGCTIFEKELIWNGKNMYGITSSLQSHNKPFYLNFEYSFATGSVSPIWQNVCIVFLWLPFHIRILLIVTL